MHVIFIIVLLFKISKAEDSVSKYIDLLPDKEKQEFLDKIARRILDEVQTKDDRPKGSGELTDGQLNEHEEFVNRILKEETQNLRKNSNSTGGVESVRTLNNKNDINNVDGYVDLTLRTDRSKRDDNRRVFTGYTEDNENNQKHDTDGNETEIDIQVKNFRRSKVFADETTVIDEELEHVTQSDTINVGNDDNLVTENNVELTHEPQEINSHATDKDSVDKEIENENHQPVKDAAILEDADVVSESKINKLSELNINNEMIPSTEAIEEPEHTSKRDPRSYNESEVKQNHSSETHNEPNTVEKLADSKVINVEITPATETNKVTDGKLNDKPLKIEATSFGLNFGGDATTVTTEGITATLSPIEDSKLNGENEKTLHDENTENNGINQNDSGKPDVDSKKLDVHSYYLINNMIKMLRQNFAENDANNMEFENFQNLKGQFDGNKIKEYKVHEVSPDASPFVKMKSQKTIPKLQPVTLKSPINEEQPFLVPIYNYSPNNAFFNPHNIFGPNYGSDNEKDGYTINNNDDAGYYNMDEDDDKEDAYQKGNHKNQNKFEWDYYVYNEPLLRNYKFKSTKEPKQNNAAPLPTEVNKPTAVDSYFNPNDYLETNYFSVRHNRMNSSPCLRNICQIEPATEYSDTSNDDLLDNKVQNTTIRKIRALFLEKKYFSSIDPNQSLMTLDLHDQSPASLQNVISNINHKTNSIIHLGQQDSKSKGKLQRNSKNIAVDYYFDRARSDSEANEEGDERYPATEPDQVRDFHIPLESYDVHKLKDYSHEINPAEQNKPRHRKTRTHTDYNLIKSILDMVPEQDIVTTLIKLQKLDLQKAGRTKKRRNHLDEYVTVLGDMIKENNRALVKYDWLGTTVDLQTAIKKMLDMADAVQNGYDIHPSDMELLKYLVYLHSEAKEELAGTKVIGNELRAMLLPRNKNKKNRGIITESGLLNRGWLIRMTEQQSIPDDALRDFEEFLKDLETALYDLHTALKYIAMITKYNNQKWFENLKQIHVDSRRKQLLEVLLHLCTSRLLVLVEETSHNGLEDDYLRYVAKNAAEVKTSKEELVVILRLLQELKNYKEFR